MADPRSARSTDPGADPATHREAHHEADREARRDLADAVTVTAVRDVMNASDRLRNAVARHYGLNQSDIVAMSHLAARGSLTQSELAAALNLTGASVTAVADRLEQGGLARRVAHPTDRRRVVLEPTALALARIGASRALIVAAMSGIADPQRVATVLTEVSARLQTHAVDVGAFLDTHSPDARP